ncbi:DUF4862 domain-containing protein [Occultella aeris]|uniref:DUF4862 domain-containing protein n=1 Tax=Occultella aeris TaxID=2761496 RepID=A0A7M4DFA5_9MICO|nr:DUF4862 family protein [Occultella aeris]VZO35598.1 hypothetical protein HALOF300_00796 [Occultella aeris]
MTGAGLVLGAYALFAGREPDELPDAYRALDALSDVDALEIPLENAVGATPGWEAGTDGLPTLVPEGWDLVITCIPTVVGRLSADANYGLASTDADGRAAAVEDVRRALTLAQRAADLAGRQRIRAIEINSAPTGTASVGEFERSLTQLLESDPTGTTLAVEHCDAPRPGRRPEKGFLELHAELTVIDALADPRLGVTVNWGRSAIEGRSAETPEEHVRMAAERGRLAGLIFSGATPAPGTSGVGWQDGHIAPRGAGGDGAWSESLLGPEEMRRTFAAAGSSAPSYRGLKVTAGPPSRTVAERLEVARDAIAMLLDAERQAAGAAQ